MGDARVAQEVEQLERTTCGQTLPGCAVENGRWIIPASESQAPKFPTTLFVDPPGTGVNPNNAISCYSQAALLRGNSIFGAPCFSAPITAVLSRGVHNDNVHGDLLDMARAGTFGVLRLMNLGTSRHLYCSSKDAKQINKLHKGVRYMAKMLRILIPDRWLRRSGDAASAQHRE